MNASQSGSGSASAPMAQRLGKFFVTGATGYVGAFVVRELLERRRSNSVKVLVRAENSPKAMRRIEHVMRWYEIWDESYRERLEAVAGDLSHRLLGMSEEDFTRLGAWSDAIVHCGAEVNFIYPYSVLEAANVHGTETICQLASQSSSLPIFHVSTVDVFTLSGLSRPFTEDRLPAKLPSKLAGYPLTKWMGEKVFEETKEDVGQVCIFRPAWILGHTSSGASPTSNFLLNALKGFIKAGIFPDTDYSVSYALTVDTIAKAIVDVIEDENRHGQFFHMWSNKPARFPEIYDWIESFGYSLKRVSIAEAYEHVRNVGTDSELFPLLPELFPDGAQTAGGELNWGDPEVECSNFLAMMREKKREPASLTEETVHLILDFLVRKEFLPSPNAKEGKVII